MQNDKIIFLDIDGVLNRLGTMEEGRTTTRWNGCIGMEPELVERFNTLVEDTGVSVVLSSTWRLDEDWLQSMKANGLNTDKFIGRTPRMPRKSGGVEMMERGYEINAWINANDMAHAKIAIIDDDNDMLPSQKLFRTNYRFGLTQEIADSIRYYFQ